ncbi:MAG TPA: methyltransferase domain-containing protein [Burkholderiaceae bacterium]|nr:methyltransferase domain-containing protein [Burkholderiaceae bacterium]
MDLALRSPTFGTTLPAGVVSADGRWFIETVNGEERRFELTSAPLSATTRWQDVAVIDTAAFGRMLVIDGETQSAERDEFVYHEALVQPALLGLPRPQEVLIIGGGEGATLREVLRRGDVERVVMVDIDDELIRFARNELGAWHRGAFEDRRVELLIGDGFKYLTERRLRFDLIISDVCDYLPGTAAATAYGPRFLQAAAASLKPGGAFVMQAGELGMRTVDLHAATVAEVRTAFGSCMSYATFVESFWSEWSFVLAGPGAAAIALASDHAVDRRIARHGLQDALRFYDGAAHERMFRLPKHLKPHHLPVDRRELIQP